jgi:hypothetical protein
MLEKVLEYKWHIVIVISSLVALIVMYQVYSTNKKVNMLYKCINELGYRVEELSKGKSSSEQPRPLFKKSMKKVEIPLRQREHREQREPQSSSPTVSPPRKLPSISPERRVKPQPLVNETIIFQVSQPMHPKQQQQVSASTIEEIDSDSDVEVDEVKMKDVDLDKALEAELSELNNEEQE